MARQLSILVVDDDMDNANSLAELFELEGHRATVVHSGGDAIAAFAAAHFDVAFMDVMMPGKNGVESFLEIKRMCPDARVYMMTGYSVEQLLRQAMDNGALGILSKPVDPDKVMQALSEIGDNGIVVVAEDDPGFGAQLQQMISGAGRPCSLVRDSGAALACALGSGDVLIFDLQAPLIDGVGVYAQLRTEGRAAPTIIITPGGAEYHDTVEAISDVAVTGVLNKPFDPLALLNRLDQLAA